MKTLAQIEVGAYAVYPLYILYRRDKNSIHKNKELALINFIVQSLRVSKNQVNTIEKIKYYSGSYVSHQDLINYINIYYSTDFVFYDIMEKLHLDLMNIFKNVYMNESNVLLIKNENYLAPCKHTLLNSKCREYTRNSVSFFDKNIDDFLISTYLDLDFSMSITVPQPVEEIVKYSHTNFVYEEDFIIKKNIIPEILIDIKKYAAIDENFNQTVYSNFIKPSGMDVKFPVDKSLRFYDFFRIYKDSICINQINRGIYHYDNIKLDRKLHRFFFLKNRREHMRAFLDHILYQRYDPLFDVLLNVPYESNYLEYYISFAMAKKSKEFADPRDVLLKGDDQTHVSMTISQTTFEVSDIVEHVFPDYVKNSFEKEFKVCGDLPTLLKFVINNKVTFRNGEKLYTNSNCRYTNEWRKYLKHKMKKMVSCGM